MQGPNQIISQCLCGANLKKERQKGAAEDQR